MLFGIRLIGLCREANDWGVGKNGPFYGKSISHGASCRGVFVMGCDDYNVKELIQDRIGRR